MLQTFLIKEICATLELRISGSLIVAEFVEISSLIKTLFKMQIYLILRICVTYNA